LLAVEEGGRVSFQLREECMKVYELSENETQKLNWRISDKQKYGRTQKKIFGFKLTKSL